MSMGPTALPLKASGSLSTALGSATFAPGRDGIESCWLPEHHS